MRKQLKRHAWTIAGLVLLAVLIWYAANYTPTQWTFPVASAAAGTAFVQIDGSISNTQVGLVGVPLTPEMAQAMKLPSGQQGILVEEVFSGSPADQANVHGSYKVALVNGHRLLIGGDVIVAANGRPVTDGAALSSLQPVQPGQSVTLTLLRDGREIKIQIDPGRGS